MPQVGFPWPNAKRERSSLLEWCPMNKPNECGILSDKENKAAEKWRTGHRCKRNVTRITSITILPSGIGPRVDIQCVTCGKTKDISDYESW